MAKMVTRSIQVFRHSFGEVSFQDGKPEIGDVKRFDLDGKLGPKTAKKFQAENGLEGYSLLGIETFTEKWAVPIDVFMANAVKVEEKADESTAE